jgi:hypothetical protein
MRVFFLVHEIGDLQRVAPAISVALLVTHAGLFNSIFPPTFPFRDAAAGIRSKNDYKLASTTEETCPPIPLR